MIDNDAIITNSKIDESASLYYRCWIRNSMIKYKAIIGDYSRITSSQIDDYVRIDRNNLIYHSIIGRYTYTGPFDMIFKTTIGNFSSISYGVTIGPPEHDYHRISTHPFLYDPSYDIFGKDEILYNNKFDKQTEIGSDVWIGCNATILRGCKIGDGAIVGANSLVKQDVPPYAIVAGVPARIIKYRFDKNKIQNLLSKKWWEWDIEKIKRNKSLFLNNELKTE